MLMLRVMTWISLRLGAACGRVVLHRHRRLFPAVRTGAAVPRRATIWPRVWTRPARWRDLYRHFFSFASTIHDRVYLLNRRFDLFEIDVHGEQEMLDACWPTARAHF